MSFKAHIQILMATVMSLSAVGCTDYINGEKKKPEVIEFSDERFKCLQKLPDQMKELSVGEAIAPDIEAAFNCMTDALKYFNKKTFGSVDGGYTVEEIRRFFGKYFLKQNNVSAEFALELMKIKRALVGGTTDQLSKVEISKLVDILDLTKAEVVLLAPHLKILLNQVHQERAEWEQITTATEQLRRSAKRLLEVTQIAKSEYSFEDGKKVLAGFADFIQGDQTFAPYDKYSQWVPIIEAVKNVLIGRRAVFSGITQWSASLDTFIDLYELLLKYHYNLSDIEFNDAAKLRQISQFLSKTISLIANSHQMKTLSYIPAQDLDILIDRALPKTPLTVKPASLKKVYRAVLLKMLDPIRKSDTRGFLGLEVKHLATLQREFNVWRLAQSFVDHAPFSDRAGTVSQEQLVAAYAQYDKSYVIERGLTEDPYEQQALLDAWQDYGLLLQNKMPVVFNSKGQMYIAPNTAATGQTWKSLSKANLMRSLSRMLMVGYGDKTGGLMANAGMSTEGLSTWYSDFREFFLDLGAFDPRTENSGSRSFQEANFFTFSGNGDASMNQAETFEFVSTLFAAGLSTSEALQASLRQVKACTVEDLDLFGKPFLKQDCFQMELKARVSVFFSNLPGMSAYISRLDEKQWNEFFTHLLAASVTEDQRLGLIDTANIRTMVTILHYVESLVVLYDADKNQSLSLKEVYTAAPRFMTFLKTATTATRNETLLTEGFAYLVFKGGIPSAGQLATFQLSKAWGLEDAQRINILRIFGTLKEKLDKDKLNKPKK